MRLIGTVPNENQAGKIAAFLEFKGIENRYEVSFEAEGSSMSYHLWIVDEDKIDEAMAYFLRFQEKPFDPEFEVPIEKRPVELPQEEPVAPESIAPKAATPLTFLLLGLCIFLFIWNGAEEVGMEQRGFLDRPFAMTSLQAHLLYDLPAPFESFQNIVDPLTMDQTFQSLPSSSQTAIESPLTTSYWQGAYKWLIFKIKNQNVEAIEGPLFTKIFQGQFWRLLSPCFLHGGFFHILFNMLWLWFLGRPIEERLGLNKTLLLTVIAGVGSNTAQYMMSGPLFLGYSGIIMGLAAFIWMRQRRAPWEGYPLNRSTISFLFLFIGAISALTVISFFIQIFTETAFSPNIANTAHLVGGVMGAFLGRFEFFASKGIK